MKKMFIVATAIFAILVLSHMEERARHASGAGTIEKFYVTAKPRDPAEAATRLAYMRKHLRPYWVPMEAGGMFLLPSMDEAKTAAFFQDMADRMPVPGRDSDMYGQLTEEVSAFFDTAKLAPGVYRLENYHREYAVDGKIRLDANGHEDT